MAKKIIEGEQPKVADKTGSQGETRQEQTQEKKSAQIVTSEGNTIDKIRIFHDAAGIIMVQADYGKLQEGKTAKERRAGIYTLSCRFLNPSQRKEYQRLNAKDPNKAKEYAARQAYPMHVDDAAFHKKAATINGRKVDYIILEKLEANKLSVDKKHLAGSWQLSFGQKGKEDTTFIGILNAQERAMICHRCEVEINKNGNIVGLGEPLTMADIAARVEKRILEHRKAKDMKFETAKNVDWKKLLSTHQLPEGAKLQNVHFSQAKNDPDRIWISGKVNGIEIFALLTPNETAAVRNKIITLEQAATVNKEFYTKIKEIVKPIASNISAAVKAVVDRASSPSAKAFTPEQVKVLNEYASNAESPEDRLKVFNDVWVQAKTELSGVNEAWVKDAHQELNDLAGGVIREEQNTIKR